MADPAHCACCGALLSRDDIGLIRKLINRGSDMFLCLSCLARHFQLTEDVLREKIREYKAMGCTLFD